MPTEVMVVAIVAVVMMAGIANRYMKLQTEKTKYKMDDGLVEKLGRIDKLEERVRVLEKIITNKKVSLADEIDSL